jgi:multiple sugar transport system ATP-binding protein
VYVTHDQVEAMTMGDRIVVMKEGSVQQVDDPLGLYNRPRNQFVAGFIGSPPMNFFRGAIERRSSGLWFAEARTEVAGFAVAFPESIAEDLTAYVGRPVVFGARPEDVAVRSSMDSDFAAAFGAGVEVVEPMGAETYLYLNTGAHTFVARVPPYERPAIGQRVNVAFDMSKCHVFDAVTEMTLAHF